MRRGKSWGLGLSEMMMFECDDV